MTCCRTSRWSARLRVRMETMTDRLSVAKDGDTYVVRSQDSEIKQTFFSWASFGSGGGNDRPEYYGRDVDPRSLPPGTMLYGKDAEKWLLDSPDDLCWEWHLTRESVVHLVKRMRTNLGDDEVENEASEHVIAVFEKV